MTNVDSAFKEYFPKMHEDFEKNNYKIKGFQKKTILNVVERGNTLCIMPTGGGKSLIYWMSAALMGGITMVVSPLIALIDEQAEKIREQGYEVLSIHGGISARKQEEMIADFANGKTTPKFIFVSPEKIATDGLFEHAIKKRKKDIKLFVIDEVHCVSQWGIGFRPFYKRIPDFIERAFGGKELHLRILALTATLNPKEVIDICNEFHIERSNIIRDEMLMRKNLSLKVLKFSNENEKEAKLWDLIKMHKDEKILVYVYRIASERGVERLAEKATEQGYKSVHFHGELAAKERQEIISRFKENEISVIFATNAFGMGIDIPDVRVAIHFMIPESVEQYYQEVGRSGRDGQAANTYLLFSNKNIDVKRKYFIEGSFPRKEELIEVYKKLAGQGKKLQNLPYFDDEEIQICLPYYIDSDLVRIKTKGFASLAGLHDIDDPDIQRLFDLTETKNLITISKRSDMTIQTIVDTVYEAVITGSVKTQKPLNRRLIIEILEPVISGEKLQAIADDINEKLKYKYDLLDYLIYIVNECNSSQELHQEIGRYLGVEKHELNKIYSTTKGDWVRSKSEVIIANLLASHGISYEYEKKLEYGQGKWIEPDFTIMLANGKELYWEHLGMLGNESYDNRWLQKQGIYDTYFKGQLVVTYEGATITDSATKTITKITKLI